MDFSIEAWPGEKASVVSAAKAAAQARQEATVVTEEEAVAKKLVDLDMPHLDRITTMYIGQSFADMDGDGEKSIEEVETHQDLSNLLKHNNGGIEVNEDEAETQELQQIITGEDAIAYFAKSGSVSKTKLLYANRVESEHFAPYELVVVPEDKVNPEYFTISATGIVRVAPGQLSECILLTEWMHQSLMFRVLQSMNFFKHYIHKKVITQWRANARYEVFCHRRQRLTRCCFFAKPMFVDSIVQVNSLVREVEEVKIMHIDQNCVYTISELMDKQQQIRASPVSSAQKDFEQKHEAAIGVIDRLIATVQGAFHIEPTVDQPNSKSKSMVQEKEEAREKARLLRIAKRDEEMLGDCIRTMDYMFQAALVQTVYDAVKQFWGRLDQKNAGKLFMISVDMTDQAIILDPGIYDFMDMLQGISEGWFQTLSNLQSMTCVRQYDQFCRVQNHHSVKDIMMKDRIYLEHQANIQDFITGAIEDVQANSNSTFERYRKIFDFGKIWDSAAFNEKEHNYDELSVQMDEMRWFQEELASFKIPLVWGIFVVNGQGLKDKLVPIPEAALTCMKNCLLGLARAKCKECYSQYDTANKMLELREKDLNKFATYVKMYQQVQNDRDDMEDLMCEVEQMYTFLRDFKVRMSDEDEFYYGGLKDKEQDFSSKKVLEASHFISEVKEEMALETYQRALKVEEEMKLVSQELFTGSFIDPEKIVVAHEVLEELDKLQESAGGKGANLHRLWGFAWCCSPSDSWWREQRPLSICRGGPDQEDLRWQAQVVGGHSSVAGDVAKLERHRVRQGMGQ